MLSVIYTFLANDQAQEDAGRTGKAARESGNTETK